MSLYFFRHMHESMVELWPGGYARNLVNLRSRMWKHIKNFKVCWFICVIFFLFWPVKLLSLTKEILQPQFSALKLFYQKYFFWNQINTFIFKKLLAKLSCSRYYTTESEILFYTTNLIRSIAQYWSIAECKKIEHFHPVSLEWFQNSNRMRKCS